MFILILLALIVLIGVVLTIVEIHRDGYRAVPTDPAQLAGRDALDRAAATTAYR